MEMINYFFLIIKNRNDLALSKGMDKNELEIVFEFFCGFTCLQLAENSKDDSEQLTTSFFAREDCQVKNNASIICSINDFEAVCIINITSSSNMLFQSLRI